MSKPYAEVIGNPIAHSKSPLIHGFWLEKLGIDAEYRACHVRSEELTDYFTRRREDANWRGCNITVPHKETATKFVAALLPGYQEIGAINVLVPRFDQATGAKVFLGANTDVDGIAGAINSFHDRAFNFGPVPPRSVAIIGAGGAARAAVAALKWRGLAGDWRIAVRRPEAGERLLAAFGINGRVIPISDDALSGADIVINASAMGMGEDAGSTLSLATLGSGQGRPLVFDMVYKPLETGLILAAKKRGFAVIDGLEMLVGQADSAFSHFFGQPAPREHDAELRALLTA